MRREARNTERCGQRLTGGRGIDDGRQMQRGVTQDAVDVRAAYQARTDDRQGDRGVHGAKYAKE